MIKILPVVLSSMLLLSNLYAAQEDTQRKRVHSVRKAVDSVAKLEPKEVDITQSLKQMFTDGKASGQIRLIYGSHNYKNSTDTYATALGGILKYELAEFNGFNAGVAFYTSQDLGFATGDGAKHNAELSSSDGSYADLSEAYINYRYQDLNLRAGRQTLDTPLADSDDIRMIQNTFEAYMASYDYNGFNFLGGYINSWEGIDQDLDDGWKTAGEDGVYLGGVSYSDMYEFTAYYYNFAKIFNAFYIDGGIQYPISNNYTIHAVLQYLNESELDNSNVDATIYGGLVEFVAYGVGFNIAYNKADKSKKSFSGTGGGKLFTSMDTMIIDEIAIDREAYAVVGGISYSYKNFNFLYAYGSFKGDENSAGIKENIVEQDIGCEYHVNKEFSLAAIYAMSDDKEYSQTTDYDWRRIQIMLNYNF